MKTKDIRFHEFDTDVSHVELPMRFTYPFCYRPHELSVLASKQLQNYLDTQKQWHDELEKGKMMGVLVVKRNDEIGFLAAFSGNLQHRNDYGYFVPAVYDLLDENGFFRKEEDEITQINRRIKEELDGEERKKLLEKIVQTEEESKEELANYREIMNRSKQKRDELRQREPESELLIAESQYQKAEYRRIKKRWQQKSEDLRLELGRHDAEINKLRDERKMRSAMLQHRVFKQFKMLNARGEIKDLCEIFSSTPQRVPPAGSGECAAPKLLQYAYINGYEPIAMAEFWVGRSPKDEVRHHGKYYPSCKRKCQPILEWMLEGLNVEDNPLASRHNPDVLNILYEDEWIVAIDKPDGMMSVPGKLSVKSAAELLAEIAEGRYEPLVVHRLDMATSGVLMFAKSRIVQKSMQAMFKDRRIRKTYVAIVDGEIKGHGGIIDLPLIFNPDDRPRQMVNHEHGKPAKTIYEVTGVADGKTRLLLYPETGRTHQLRVHCAHVDGLNAPICGDLLYGTGAERLYLHACAVEFTHPVTHQLVNIKSQCGF